MANFRLKQEKSLKTISIYCEAQIKDHLIFLILDSGLLGCVVLANFLKEVGISINHPSTVLTVRIHREQKHPLGEAKNYAVIIENDWMKKIQKKEKPNEKEEKNTLQKKKLKISIISEEPEACQLCLKVEHNDETCIFKKGQLIETAYIEQKAEMKDLLAEHNSLFIKNTGQLGRTSVIQYEIFVKDSLPIKQRFYLTSKPEHEFIRAEIQHINKARII
ncbi:30190_t:CDS:2 [Gigaspora margarita]|uniref:30190_t:CDS:1 n=1 Tax=Gigaspora margarita TaxID=4874 RepID=A0ABN7WJB4_GIGMA|nr:30190_t:CDS:2 [Gigaspora margarita]